MTITMLLFLSICVIFPLQAEDTMTYEEYPYAIGVVFSEPVWGLSYHQRFGDNALQGTLGFSYYPNPTYQAQLAYSIAVDYQRTIFGADFNRFLGAQLYLDAYLAHTGETAYNWETYTYDPFEAQIVAGVGFGVEAIFFQYFSVPVEFIYSFSYSPTEDSFPSNVSVDLVPRIGLRFRFK
ncbi:MAG: hypothetical protein ACQEWA_01905 [Sphaerochaetaceae bacterium]